jgi:hypothetical protein
MAATGMRSADPRVKRSKLTGRTDGATGVESAKQAVATEAARAQWLAHLRRPQARHRISRVSALQPPREHVASVGPGRPSVGILVMRWATADDGIRPHLAVGSGGLAP